MTAPRAITLVLLAAACGGRATDRDGTSGAGGAGHGGAGGSAAGAGVGGAQGGTSGQGAVGGGANSGGAGGVAGAAAGGASGTGGSATGGGGQGGGSATGGTGGAGARDGGPAGSGGGVTECYTGVSQTYTCELPWPLPVVTGEGRECGTHKACPPGEVCCYQPCTNDLCDYEWWNDEFNDTCFGDFGCAVVSACRRGGCLPYLGE